MATVDDFKKHAKDKASPGTEVTETRTLPAMLKAFLPEIERALPKHLTGERMARIALTAFRRTPKLAECDPRSVFACVIQAAQLGLEPDTMGRAYLIPYENRKRGIVECQFVPGWKGLVDLMNRSGAGTVYTGVIFKDQRYTFQDGSARSLVVHNETDLDDPEDITHAYAIGWVKAAEHPIIELWRVGKIQRHRDRYNKVGQRHYSYENWEMYARKVPLLQVLKYMPCSAEMIAAIGLNDAAEIGAQSLSVDDAVHGTWVPTTEVEDATVRETKKATANPPPDVEAPPAVSFEALLARLQSTTDLDMLDADASLIELLTHEAQRMAAKDIYTQRRGYLTTSRA